MKNVAIITPFCRGNAGSVAGTCPRMARVILLASPSFVGAMLAVSRGHLRLQILNVSAYLTRVFLFRGPLAPPGLPRAIFALVLGLLSTLCHKGVATNLALVATASSELKCFTWKHSTMCHTCKQPGSISSLARGDVSQPGRVSSIHFSFSFKVFERARALAFHSRPLGSCAFALITRFGAMKLWE